MEFKSEVNTYLGLKDKYGKIINEQILIVAKAGKGKTLAGEGIAEKYHLSGYITIVIADPKDELEYAYQMFKPREKYHLDHLRKIGKKPFGKKVKIYHPYTNNIPTISLPDINFYTFSLKDLGRKEWGLLAETDWDTETMRILLQASQNISKEDGLYGIMHYIQNAVKGKKVGRTKKADPRNFLVEASSGTLKAVTEISNYLQPFKYDYFLTKDSCPLNINWKNILNDQENYHVFVSNFVKDEKLKDFLILALLNGIITNKKYLRKPVVVVIPEVRTLTPFRPEGHKKFLASAVKSCLSMMRSSGRGMSSILDSQVWNSIDESVRDSATVTLFGELGGGADMEKVAKAYNYRRDIRDQLKSMEYMNSFLMVGKEDRETVTVFFPGSCHAEPHYSFNEMYREEFPEKMKRYDGIIKMMNKISNDEENKFRDKIKKQEKAERERKKKEQKEKEETQNKEGKVEEKIERAKAKETQSKIQLMKLCFEMKNDESIDEKERTLRKIGKKFGLNHITVGRYIEDYSKIKNKDENHSEIENEELEEEDGDK